jgi:hypothetical protein
MKRLATRTFCFAVCLALAAAPGCGSGKVKVTGKVTKGGTPLASTTGHVQVKLIPADAKANYTTYPAIANPDGTFEIPDITPGKYKVAVEQQDTPMSDGLGGAFNDQNTRIVRDIDGKAPLNIDVSKPEG